MNACEPNMRINGWTATAVANMLVGTDRRTATYYELRNGAFAVKPRASCAIPDSELPATPDARLRPNAGGYAERKSASGKLFHDIIVITN